MISRHATKLSLTCLVGVGLLLTGRPAESQETKHFNFTIPVELTRLPPNIDRMFVHCRARTLAGADIGLGRAPMTTITGGAYRGDITIRFDADPGQDPAAATHYECGAAFAGTESGRTVHYYNPSLTGSVSFPLAAGAPFRLFTGVQPIPR